MADDYTTAETVVSRRKFIAASSAVGAAGLAGCSQGSDAGGNNDGGNENRIDENRDGGSPELLTAEGSSTVYPISNKGSSYWNANAPPSDGEYWGSNDEGSVPAWDSVETDKHLADYFAGQYGFDETGQRSKPPYNTTVSLSHSGTGCKAVRDGLVDIGNSSGPITAELGISETKAKNNYVDHVVGRDGQPVVVSSDIYDSGVQQLTGEQIRKIYQDEITNWSEVGGPDNEIFCIGRAEGSGTDTSFRLNMLGSADAPMPGVDSRFGQNQQVAEAVENNDGAIAYMALAFTSESVQPIAIDFEGTVYKPNKDAENTIFDSAYPLNRDLHMYTRITEDSPRGTDLREGAFLNMFLTEFGQIVFVEQNNYIPLPTKDIESERAKLPEKP